MVIQVIALKFVLNQLGMVKRLHIFEKCFAPRIISFITSSSIVLQALLLLVYM